MRTVPVVPLDHLRAEPPRRFTGEDEDQRPGPSTHGSGSSSGFFCRFSQPAHHNMKAVLVCGRAQTGTSMPKHTIVLSVCLTVVVACADHPQEARPLTGPCYAANADSSERIPTAPEKTPRSNIFKLNYFYPAELARQHLQGRALVRVKVAETGKIDSAEFLRVEAPPPVESAMCNLLRKLRYDVSKPGYDTVDSRTFVLGIRYCVGNCSRVPAYPGFERKEITITANGYRG